MRKKVEFKATEYGSLREHGVLSCGASNARSDEPYHYVNFQRPLEIGSKEDEGVYFEIDDQSLGGYNIVESCRLEKSRLTVKLNGEISELSGVTVVVYFDDSDSDDIANLCQGLKHVFKGFEPKFDGYA